MPTAPHRAPRKQSLRGWNLGGVVYHPKPRRRAKDESRVTSLSLRRSTNNVENVVVRLRQSSAICLRANARSAFLFTGSPRSFHSLAMTKGTKWIIPQSLTTPAASHHPSNGGELGSSHRETVILYDGWGCYSHPVAV